MKRSVLWRSLALAMGLQCLAIAAVQQRRQSSPPDSVSSESPPAFAVQQLVWTSVEDEPTDSIQLVGGSADNGAADAGAATKTASKDVPHAHRQVELLNASIWDDVPPEGAEPNPGEDLQQSLWVTSESRHHAPRDEPAALTTWIPQHRQQPQDAVSSAAHHAERDGDIDTSFWEDIAPAEAEPDVTEVSRGIEQSMWAVVDDEPTEDIELAAFGASDDPPPYSPPAPVAPDAFTEQVQRLERLESAWDEYQESLAKKASEAAGKPTFRINGRIHLDYWAFPDASPGIGFFEHSDPTSAQFGTDPEDQLAFRRVRLEMRGDILETMLWRMQIDFAEADNPVFKDVYVGFKELPHNQRLLVGIQKRPLGLDHLNSSRYNVFLERPLVVEAFNEDARRLGVAMSGFTDDEQFHWRYGVYNLENIADDGQYIGDDYQLSANARLSSSPWYDESSGGRGYFHWAVAGMVAHPDGNATDQSTDQNQGFFRTRPEARTVSRWIDTQPIAGAHWYEILALESMLNVGAFQLTGEYQWNWVQREVGAAGTGPDVFFHGGYLFAAYNLTGEHIPYERTTGTIGRLKPFENFFLVERCCGGTGYGWGAWQVGLRYSFLDLTSEDILGGAQHNWTLALNWFWTAYSKMQFNLIHGRIDDHAPVGGYTGGDFWIAGTRFAVEF